MGRTSECCRLAVRPQIITAAANNPTTPAAPLTNTVQPWLAPAGLQRRPARDRANGTGASEDARGDRCSQRILMLWILLLWSCCPGSVYKGYSVIPRSRLHGFSWRVPLDLGPAPGRAAEADVAVRRPGRPGRPGARGEASTLYVHLAVMSAAVYSKMGGSMLRLQLSKLAVSPPGRVGRKACFFDRCSVM